MDTTIITDKIIVGLCAPQGINEMSATLYSSVLIFPECIVSYVPTVEAEKTNAFNRKLEKVAPFCEPTVEYILPSVLYHIQRIFNCGEKDVGVLQCDNDTDKKKRKKRGIFLIPNKDTHISELRGRDDNIDVVREGLPPIPPPFLLIPVKLCACVYSQRYMRVHP